MAGRGSDDDLLFELECEDCDRQRSVSVDSFLGRAGEVVTQQLSAPLQLPAPGRVRRFKVRQEEWYGSLPHRGGAGRAWRGSHGRSSHSPASSVEEGQEAVECHPLAATLPPGCSLLPPATDQSAKSPRFLPKFLRASFSRLWRDRSGARGAVSTPVTRSPSLTEQYIQDQDRDTSEQDWPLESSPTTRRFVQESLAKGLPIIPFNYSSAEIVEKRRKSQRDKSLQSRSAKTGGREGGGAGAGQQEDKSLEGLLSVARREMEEEAQLRKISGITGYAANNSRALQRRRSSGSEYVELEGGPGRWRAGEEWSPPCSGDCEWTPPPPRAQQLGGGVWGGGAGRLRIVDQLGVGCDWSPPRGRSLPRVVRDCTDCRGLARQGGSFDQYLDMDCPHSCV